ncbi:MAG TPA: septal ring lytic transglycosylase RlpA family protein [Solirubrobacteraceae bacterium]|nr:septal ring lytic transglycosylase RlpA family protein [Solirubrobacteraceae bacterium]
MRLHRPTPPTLLALLAAAACTAWSFAPGAAALASTGAPSSGATGGSSAPGGAGAPSRSKATKAKTTVAKTGIATWFGPGFYGQTTACGQKLTPAVVGVANRTLPCGTLVKITYHGHTLTVPVLDRGPYASNGASWDLTAGAANALGVDGIARIGTRVVGSVPNTAKLGSPPVTPAEAASGGAQAG